MERPSKTRFICETAVIAAIYAVVTLLLAPFGFLQFQVRVSEAMCVLPFFTPAAVPGLFIGCLIANLFGSGTLGLMDIIVGSLATLLAAFVTWKLRVRSKWLLPLPSVLANAFLVSWTLSVMLGLPYWMNVLTVGIGQAIACYAIGMPLWFLLKRYQKNIFQRI